MTLRKPLIADSTLHKPLPTADQIFGDTVQLASVTTNLVRYGSDRGLFAPTPQPQRPELIPASEVSMGLPPIDITEQARLDALGGDLRPERAEIPQANPGDLRQLMQWGASIVPRSPIIVLDADLNGSYKYMYYNVQLRFSGRLNSADLVGVANAVAPVRISLITYVRGIAPNFNRYMQVGNTSKLHTVQLSATPINSQPRAYFNFEMNHTTTPIPAITNTSGRPNAMASLGVWLDAEAWPSRDNGTGGPPMVYGMYAEPVVTVQAFGIMK